MPSVAVLLYVPNLIVGERFQQSVGLPATSYVRLLLIFSAFYWYHSTVWLLTLYSLSVILDGIDGYVARRLNQTSAFGALLDVVVDNIGRGMLWCRLFTWGYLVSVIEWLTLVSTHCNDPNWKVLTGDHPWIVVKVMDKGFKTKTGMFAIGGLHVLPIMLYAHQMGFLTTALSMSTLVQTVLICPFLAGRLLSLTVELYFIYRHLECLCQKSKD